MGQYTPIGGGTRMMTIRHATQADGAIASSLRNCWARRHVIAMTPVPRPKDSDVPGLQAAPAGTLAVAGPAEGAGGGRGRLLRVRHTAAAGTCALARAAALPDAP